MLSLYLHNDGTHPSRHYCYLAVSDLPRRRDRNRAEQGIERDAKRRRSLWQTRPRHGRGGTRADEEDARRKRKAKRDPPIIRVKGRGERDYEALTELTRSGLAPISVPPPSPVPCDGTVVYLSFAFACANRWGVALPLGVHIRSLAHLHAREIVKRKIAPVTLSNLNDPRSRAGIRPEACRGNAAGPSLASGLWSVYLRCSITTGRQVEWRDTPRSRTWIPRLCTCRLAMMI